MKKCLIVFISIFSIFVNSFIGVCATEKNYVYDEFGGYYDEYGNYENPTTGEYFRWSNPNAKGEIGDFSFKIRASVTSSIRFQPDKTNILIEVRNVGFVDYSDKPKTCCNNHHFEVDFKKNGLSTNLAYFTAPTKYDAYELGGGFSTTSKYAVCITNNDKLPDNVYLNGSGNVYAY